MKFFTQTIFRLIVCVLTTSAQQKTMSFEDYQVSKFKGKVYKPKWIKKVSKSEWRDELGKFVEPPEINFAGKYYVAAHSCGTGCRYYTITDLAKGKELQSLDDFASTDPLPKTSDGRDYLTILYYRPDSKMLVAQYLVDFDSEKESCRERSFIFERGKVKPITKIKYKCGKL
jgi:hypothetical protein